MCTNCPRRQHFYSPIVGCWIPQLSAKSDMSMQTHRQTPCGNQGVSIQPSLPHRQRDREAEGTKWTSAALVKVVVKVKSLHQTCGCVWHDIEGSVRTTATQKAFVIIELMDTWGEIHPERSSAFMHIFFECPLSLLWVLQVLPGHSASPSYCQLEPRNTALYGHFMSNCCHSSSTTAGL